MEKHLIGLILAHTGTSYGMNLQAYATQHLLELMGFETEIIRTKSRFPQGVVMAPGLFQHFVVQFKRKQNKKRHNLNRLTDELHIRNNQLRISAAQNFRNEKLHNYSPILDYRALCKYASKYDAVIIGSDQCWLPGFSFSYLNTMNFVPAGVKRISYATSLGVSHYPNYCYYSARKAWRKIDCLSVREQSGANIIREVCGNDIQVRVVLDPTYLFSKEEWEEMIPPSRLIDGHYILSFMLGYDDSQKEFIRDYAQKKGIKLVSILSNESSSAIDTTYADETIIGASPADFVNYIRFADCVFTDSFHGIAFSIINQRDFYAFYPKRDFAKGKDSRNSRIDHILNCFNISNRLIVSHFREEEDIHINYMEVGSVLSEKKRQSIDFLKNALSL